MIGPSPQLKEVPSGIHHLTNLKTLEEFVDMLDELINRTQTQTQTQPRKRLLDRRAYHISCVNLWSRIGKEMSITQICTLQQYFNRKVENARVGEDKNELNVNSISFQVFCCQRLSWKEIQLQRQPQTNKECHLCQHGHVYYV